MAYRSQMTEDWTIVEAVAALNLDTLRPLGQSAGRDAPSRKQDLAPYLTRMLAREDVVRRLLARGCWTRRAEARE